MIYLITGVPGSGKTLYAVSTLVKTIADEVVTLKDGHQKKRRLVVDGVKGLLLEHDMMAPGVQDADGNVLPGDGEGVWNWQDWCRPGDVIFIDEVQRWWRPRGMGTKPPAEIKALETHRHKGVDFVIVTQNPMLLDQNVRRLVGRHLHVRRLFGLNRAVIYDWDGCCTDVHRTKSATVSYFSYPKSAFALYESSELHTKQRQKIPPWLIIPVLAVVGAVLVGPKAYGVMQGSMTGKGISSPASPAPAQVASGPMRTGIPGTATASLPLPAASAPIADTPSTSAPELPIKFAGCVATKSSCGCFDTGGYPVSKPREFCVTATSQGAPKPLTSDMLPQAEPLAPRVVSSADVEMVGWAVKRRVSQ